MKPLTLWARLLAALPLGYALVALAVSGMAALAARLGMARGDAVVMMAMLGFVLYLLWLLWTFAVRSLARLYGVLALGLSLGAALNWLLPPLGA